MNYEYDKKDADRAVRFFHKKLHHVTGTGFAGKPFILEPWQEKIVRDVFGCKRPDGTRRYRTAYLEIARKNGKTSLCAGLALYLLLCDGEAAPEVYSAAGDRRQARICFEAARDMIASDARGSNLRPRFSKIASSGSSSRGSIRLCPRRHTQSTGTTRAESSSTKCICPARSSAIRTCSVLELLCASSAIDDRDHDRRQ